MGTAVSRKADRCVHDRASRRIEHARPQNRRLVGQLELLPAQLSALQRRDPALEAGRPSLSVTRKVTGVPACKPWIETTSGSVTGMRTELVLHFADEAGTP